MSGEYEKLLEKYKKYRIIWANHWVVSTRQDGEYCRIDGISDEHNLIMSIGFDYEMAKKLKECLEKYIREYEWKYSYFG